MLQDGIRIFPGPDSYFANDPAEVRFADGQVNSIVSLRDHFARSEYALEPRLVTSLFDHRREKRRLVEFRDLPPDLVNAVLAIEDRRFLQHSGVDYLRILKAAYVDIRAGRVEQGASTITMQLARSFFFSSQRTWKRKLAETLVAFQLEGRLTKEQILEYYCNKIYLGQRGSFTISGFGEAAQAYFGKDVREPDAAGSGLPGRDHAGSESVLSVSQSRGGPAAPEYRFERHGGDRLDYSSTARRSGGYASRSDSAIHSGQRGALLYRHGEETVARKLFRRRAGIGELPHLYDTGSEAAAGCRGSHAGRLGPKSTSGWSKCARPGGRRPPRKPAPAARRRMVLKSGR